MSGMVKSQQTTLARMEEATGFGRNQIEIIKDTVARGATDEELMLFLSIAKRSGLDPFSRQIYLIERRVNVDGQWKTSRQPLTGIDGLRSIADRTGNYSPGRAPTFEYSDDGKLYAATAYILKFARGSWHEVAATAHYAEYAQLKKDGTPTAMWGEKPHIMLAKCAEALALRRAFPADMSGLYTSDEMREQQPNIPPTAPPVNVATGEIIEAEVIDERAEALTQMRQAFRAARAVNPDILTPDKAAVAVMSLEEIRSWIAAYQDAANPQPPAEDELSAENF